MPPCSVPTANGWPPAATISRSSCGTSAGGKELRTLSRPQRRGVRPGLSARRQGAGQRQRRPHRETVGRGQRRAARHVRPAAQGAVLPSPSAPMAARGRRRRRQSHSRLADQRRRQGKHEPAPLLAVRPRGGGRQAGLLARRQDARFGRRRPHASRSGTPSRCSSGCSSSGKAIGPAPWPSPPTANRWPWAGWMAAWRFTTPATGDLVPPPPPPKPELAVAGVRGVQTGATTPAEAHRQAPGRCHGGQASTRSSPPSLSAKVRRDADRSRRHAGRRLAARPVTRSGS